MKKVLILVGVLGAAAFLFYRKQIGLLKDYGYKVIGLKIKTISKTNVTFELTTRFFNKSLIEATVKEIYLDVFIEGVKSGYVTETKPFLIPSRGSSDINLRFSFNPQLILKQVVSISLSGVKRKDILVNFDGWAKVSSGYLVQTTLPIKFSESVKSYL